MYLSSAIAHRLRMEAVQQRTSKVSHVLQTKLPNTWLMTLSGSTHTHTHTVMSEAARDTMKKLGVICVFPLPSWSWNVD